MLTAKAFTPKTRPPTLSNYACITTSLPSFHSVLFAPITDQKIDMRISLALYYGSLPEAAASGRGPALLRWINLPRPMVAALKDLPP